MERYNVHLTWSAQEDIRDIVNYISNELREPATAERLAARLQEAALSLETMPERYALVPDSFLASQGVRGISVGNYTLFYLVDSRTDQVNISRILYGRRDWNDILTKEL